MRSCAKTGLITKVIEAISGLRYAHANMECFGADPRKPIEKCLEEVRSSDIFLLIIGHLYGSIEPSYGESYTHLEYKEAIKCNIPCFVYVRNEEVPVLPKYVEKRPGHINKYDEFINVLKNRHSIYFFRYGDDLAISVTRDLAIWSKDKYYGVKVNDKLDIGGYEKLVKEYKISIENTFNIIGVLSEVRDPYRHGHQKNVSNIAVKIAEDMNLEKNIIDSILYASLIHDVGYIQIPSEILSNPGKLSEIEYLMFKLHPEVGYNLTREIHTPKNIPEIIYQHHERLNGSGYPRGLTGEGILIEAKILAVADVVEAMTSHRAFRPAPGIDYALDELKKHKGILYDPEAVDIFIKIYRNNEFNFRYEVDFLQKDLSKEDCARF